MSQKKSIALRIVFFGTPEFAAVSLKKLLSDKYNVVAVVTQPDTKKGKEKNPSPSTVKQLAMKQHIPIFQPEKIDESFVSAIQEYTPDIYIVVAYGKILPKRLLDIPGFGAVNVHGSLLPLWRGPSPIQNAILEGAQETGVTIMLLDEKMDTGPILAQKKMAIDKDETAGELSDRMAAIGADILAKTLPPLAKRRIDPQPQDNSRATYCQLIEREDGHITWDATASEIYNRFRALSPWPGIFSFWESADGIRRIKLTRIRPHTGEKHDRTLGEVFLDGDDILVQAMDSAILLEEIQMEGKKSQTAAEFMRGYPLFVGGTLK